MIIYCVQIRISDIILKKEAGELIIEARSLNHFCRGKAMSVLYYEFVCSSSYSGCKEHASDYIVIWGPSGPTMFFDSAL